MGGDTVRQHDQMEDLLGATNVETTTVGDLVAALSSDSAKSNRKIEVPTFQRRLVWNPAQQRSLIESIHAEYPIGAILLYKKGAADGFGEVLQIVDGLQRTNTLREYVDHPLTLAPVSLVEDGLLTGLRNALSAVDVTVGSVAELRKGLEAWMRSEMKPGPNSATSLLTAMAPALEDKLTFDLVDAANAVVTRLREATDISAYQIPQIVYSGSISNLPEIFELVNTQGTQLSKYEIFAATWVKSGTQIDNAQVRSAIQKKYEELADAGFSIEGMPDDEIVRDHNLFEYLFGLGRVVADQFPYLFRSKKQPSETEPVAFAVATIVLGMPLGDMGKLADQLPKHGHVAPDGLIDPTKFENALFAACQQVETTLKPWLRARLNVTSEAAPVVHSDLQLVSWLSRLIIGRWTTTSPDWAEKPGWEGDWAKLQTAMPWWYLRDILVNHWRGPTYSILFDRVWERDENDELRPGRTYLEPATTERMAQELDEWFDAALERQQRKRPNVRESERLFLRFLYAHRIPVFEDEAHKFEIEHLFPVARLVEAITPDEPGWPISSIANLALFDQATNRESGKLTISEFLQGLPEDKRTSVEKMLDKYLFCAPDEVAIPPGDTFSRDYYESFLRSRWTTMLDHLLGVLPSRAEQ